MKGFVTFETATGVGKAAVRVEDIVAIREANDDYYNECVEIETKQKIYRATDSFWTIMERVQGAMSNE